ncbi:ATP-binding protein [Marinobacter sp. CHS3-4]|uniref:ATP-binding protein n=1 Tax=Marinobacter sp. CHS3-4 TaxID=3045174 RepID=UPI0024B553E2|nr:ATP-binding protein [Marinobacter sp. CHS3-4]MDI9245618.1 GAF domain-containing protein [Marinobacter sp. CHS3-4]
MTDRFSDQFDFTNCADEPIRTPGSIQPNGFVVFLDAEDLTVCSYSENAEQALAAVVGQSEAAIDGTGHLPASLLESVRAALSEPNDLSKNFVQGGHLFTVSQRGSRILLSAEPDDGSSTTTANDLNILISEVKSSHSVEQLLNTAASAVRSITGFDRVMVYRFAEDWHGEVVAENLDSGMTRFLGLHFPATDIPEQARALYLENEIRMIADVDATNIPITSLSGQPQDMNPDLTDCALRAVSPIHLQYLRNMGVAASMSISLIRDGKLWGLVACHNRRPRYVPVNARLAAKLVGDVLSLCLRLVEDAEVMEERLRRRLYQSDVLERCLKNDELVPTIANAAHDFQKLFDADAFAVINGSQVHSVGHGPSDSQYLLLAKEVRNELKSSGQSILSRSRCNEELFEGHAKLAAGILALTPSQNYDVLCLWTRQEELQEVTWAGKNQKSSEDPLNPRASFERWTETRRGSARKWKAWELDSADELLLSLQKLALRQLERLQRLSESLAQSNRDLEDFAFIASHDLQEPLRKIEAFSDMAAEEISEENPDAEAIQDYLKRVGLASSRLRGLVSDLLNYSRVGRLDYEFSECDWRQAIDKSIELVEQQENYSDFSISVKGRFPVTRTSSVLLRMIFQNLISNALKYGHPDRKNAITIEGHSDESETIWTVNVQDSGIGFDANQAEAIFKPFMRLNSKSRYPGSGIGLAIVRKAAERVGASVTATSVPGEGSTFSVRINLSE